MKNKAIQVKRLVGCARCGRTHLNLVFSVLTRPVGKSTHWATCPRNGQPILVRITEVKDK